MGVGTPSSTVPAHARLFGKYTLLAKLATGGMAEIFLARMKGVAGFEKQVVIKRILPQYADDEQFVAMFLDEARIAARINHPNVCQVYELGEVEGQYYLAMEYLEGVPLTTVLRKVTKEGRQPDLRLVTALVVQACEGLHNAHELKELDGQPIGVVHRDVSPQNLFVTVDGTVKVLDFGIAKAQGAAAKTRTGTVKGKYAYMSPEQLRGEALDRRSDVFALGVVLFESVTGRRLFHRDTDYLIFKAITDEPIPSVRELRKDLPPALAMTIHKALSRNRDERTTTARQLGQGVAKAMEPYGGLMSQLAIAELIETAFVEEIAKVREKISQAVLASNKLDEEPPRLDLGSDAAARSPSQSLQARPAEPAGIDAPEQLSERSIDPAQFVAAPPEEPDESATDVWDGTMRPPWEQGERIVDEEPPTVTTPQEVLDPLVADTLALSESRAARAIEAARAVQTQKAIDAGFEPPPPQQAPTGQKPLPPLPPPPPSVPPPQMGTPQQPMARVPTGPAPLYGGGTSFAMEELRPRRRIGLWLAGVVVGLVGAGIYVLVSSSGDDRHSGVTSTEARATYVPTPLAPPAAEPIQEAVKAPPPPKPEPAVTPEAPPPPRPEPVAAPPPLPQKVEPPPKPEPIAVAKVEPAAKPAPAKPAPQVKPRTTAPPLVKKVEREVEREERDDRLDKPERPKPEEKAGPPGFFTVDANPYANIFIDGKSMGPTPIIKHPLSPGVHRVKAAPQSGKVKFLTITIESGEVFTHKFTW